MTFTVEERVVFVGTMELQLRLPLARKVGTARLN